MFQEGFGISIWALTEKKRIVLGHIISNVGIEVENIKVDLIANFRFPSCVKDICSFFGHARFDCEAYHGF